MSRPLGSTTYHMSLSVRGALSWPPSEFRKAAGPHGYIKKNDGTAFTVEELREALFDELAQGHEKIPMGECDNFDGKTGCRGHGQENK